MPRPLLVACDVDGTLLDATEGVSPRTRAAIARVVAAGAEFVLASGRPPRWMRHIARAAGVDGYAVCCNGAVRYDIGTDVVLHATALDPVLLREVTAAMHREMPGVRFAAERVSTVAVSPELEPFIAEPGYSHPWGSGVTAYAPRAEVVGHPCVKLMASDPHRSSDEMAVLTRELAGDTVDVTFSSSAGLVELAPAGVTKATELAKLAADLGVPAERVLAFGDMPNDIEMLAWAGHGVAMAGAHESVRAAADEITLAHTADGVAAVLERWL